MVTRQPAHRFGIRGQNRTRVEPRVATDSQRPPWPYWTRAQRRILTRRVSHRVCVVRQDGPNLGCRIGKCPAHPRIPHRQHTLACILTPIHALCDSLVGPHGENLGHGGRYFGDYATRSHKQSKGRSLLAGWNAYCIRIQRRKSTRL